jgi:hypothetical protein
MDDFVSRYIDLWNEPDPVRRRATIDELWHPEGANYTASITAEGLDAIEKRVAASHDRWVGGGGHRFEQQGPVEAHHGVLRVRWVMVPTDGGPAAGAGSEILVLDEQGRIRTDHQFTEPVP